MDNTNKIRGEQIQDNTISTNNIKELDIDKVYYNDNKLENYLSKTINITLLTENWTNNEYTINNENIKSYSNGTIILNSSSSEQISEIIKSNITIKQQLDNQLILECDNVPNCDLDIAIILN